MAYAQNKHLDIAINNIIDPNINIRDTDSIGTIVTLVRFSLV